MLIYKILIVVLMIFCLHSALDYLLPEVQAQSEDKDDDSQDENESDQSAADQEDDSPDVSNQLVLTEIVESVEEVYSFSLVSDDDPFVPKIFITDFEANDSESIETVEQVGYVEELQKFRIDELVLTGVWETQGSYKALIITPEEKAHIISVGDNLGMDSGKVLSIDKEGLTVRKVLYDKYFNRNIVDKYLPIKPDDNDKENARVLRDEFKDESISLNPYYPENEDKKSNIEN